MLLDPFSVVAGALPRGLLLSLWLAATASILPAAFVFALVFPLRPSPPPTRDDTVAGHPPCPDLLVWIPLRDAGTA